MEAIDWSLPLACKRYLVLCQAARATPMLIARNTLRASGFVHADLTSPASSVSIASAATRAATVDSCLGESRTYAALNAFSRGWPAISLAQALRPVRTMLVAQSETSRQHAVFQSSLCYCL